MDDETRWIENSSCSSMQFYEKYKGKVWNYDKNSHYPTIMNSSFLMVPIERGEFKTITQKDLIVTKKQKNRTIDTIDFGIYRCVVESDDPLTRYFSLMKKTTTHTMIYFGQERTT